MKSRNETVIKGFNFLREYAASEKQFSIATMAKSTGWEESSVKAYISKQWKGYLDSQGRGKAKVFQVKKEFLRVTIEEFLSVFTQKRLVVPQYQRAKHELVLQFEFLLPLSKEEQLRRALDELFYADTLITRINEIGLEKITTFIDRPVDIDDQQYVDKVLNSVGNYFGGYSIFHVQGRFRAADLTDIKGAAQGMVNRQRYLIDETTAVVRFIAPCYTTKSEFKDDFESIVKALSEPDFVEDTESLKKIQEEIVLIRCIFFFFFVETVVRTVKGEDEIWLLETGLNRRLYRWTSAN